MVVLPSWSKVYERHDPFVRLPDARPARKIKISDATVLPRNLDYFHRHGPSRPASHNALLYTYLFFY
jgi:hypothetical protein